MAKYPAVITTMAGTNAVAEANASKQALIFTKILIGAGAAPASIDRATALTDKRLELEITKSAKTGDGQFMVQGVLTNKNLESGFYAKEIGLMAKVGEAGKEILFSYTNGGNYVDYIPDKNTPMDSYTFTITTVVGNAEKVEATVVDNGIVSISDFNAHKSDANAHKTAFNKKLDVLSKDYIKSLIKNNQGLQLTRGDNSQAVIDFITANYNDSDTNKVLNLATLKSILGQGGIVASKLDENGYVKFANGFIIQWGVIRDVRVGTTITLPIRVSAILSISGNDENANTDPCILTFNNFTNTGFNVYGRRFGSANSTLWGRYICIGKV